MRIIGHVICRAWYIVAAVIHPTMNINPQHLSIYLFILFFEHLQSRWHPALSLVLVKLVPIAASPQIAPRHYQSRQSLSSIKQLCLNMQEYPEQTRSTTMLLRAWILALPGHQQPCCWLSGINGPLSFAARGFIPCLQISQISSTRHSLRYFTEENILHNEFATGYQPSVLVIASCKANSCLNTAEMYPTARNWY